MPPVTIAVYGEITVQIHAEDAKNGFCINNNAVVKMSISKSHLEAAFTNSSTSSVPLSLTTQCDIRFTSFLINSCLFSYR